MCGRDIWSRGSHGKKHGLPSLSTRLARWRVRGLSIALMFSTRHAEELDMDPKDDRSNDYELAPTSPPSVHRHRTLSQAVEDYWHRVSDELDSPRASVSGGALV